MLINYRVNGHQIWPGRAPEIDSAMRERNDALGDRIAAARAQERAKKPDSEAYFAALHAEAVADDAYLRADARLLKAVGDFAMANPPAQPDPD